MTNHTPFKLLKPSNLEFGAISFHEIEVGDFKPSLLEGVRLVEANIRAIKQNTEKPTFTNTIEAIDSAFDPIDMPSTVLGNYTSTNASPELEKVEEEMQPILTELGNQIILDKEIFARVDEVYKSRDQLSLSTEQKMLLKKTYLSFVRNGAKLDTKAKLRIEEIDKKSALLGITFRKNDTASINEFAYFVKDEADLKGLPEDVIQAAASKASELKKPGSWAFTLKAPSLTPVMQYAEKSSLRQALWEASATKGSSGGPNDNRLVLLEIAKLKEERAHLLGYKTHAHYVLEERMAKDPKTLEKFVSKLASVYRPAALKDVEELKAFAGKNIAPWDFAFYSEKLRKQRYGFSEEELRPYFSFENVMRGAFLVAQKLYGVAFKLRRDLPTWHESVDAYEVSDRNGKFLALFYLDPFPRDSKRAGAWMSHMQSSGFFEGKHRRPHVINVGNLTPPVEKGAPALLNLREVTTIFHELGHGLHGMLSQTHYSSLAGTNVVWDFVELPSQLNENWAIEPEVLDVYAHHYKTGERIPAKLVEKVRQAQNFQAGYTGLRQLNFISVDLAWHAEDLSSLHTAEDVKAWEERFTSQFKILEGPKALVSPGFSHIFGGGYSAGYYSYKWADVLAADAFSLFQKQGIFNSELANRFRSEVLEKGGSEEADVLYRRFKGSDPDPDALLRREGLL